MSAPAQARPPTQSQQRRLPRLSLPYLLLLPSAVFMTLLFGWPMISGVLQAFLGPDGLTLASWRRMFAEPRFWEAVRNTALLIVVVIPVQFALALSMALALRARPRFGGFYFYIWAVPLAVSDLAAGLVWLAIFTDLGYLNSALVGLGVVQQGVQWLSYLSPATMFLAVAVAEIWRATSLVLVILVAGMQVIPTEYDEAAQVLGATFWQRLRHVTLPLLKPSLQVALILRTILAIQAFAAAQALTGRNFPLLVGETYEWFVNLQNPAVASAVALVVLGVSMFTSLVYLRTLRQPDPRRGGG
ncbi:MAG TPA: sugar ABC transporter permease [Pseudonocardia sp.]|uniref:carbohydrate ABC transporter permease n=1 Tax=Pseudonocardia sp. TaxID=60912 RepID=UPI002ED88C64